jgi:hypothetical protein
VEIVQAPRDLHEALASVAEIEENSTAALLLGADAQETLKKVQGFWPPKTKPP